MCLPKRKLNLPQKQSNRRKNQNPPAAVKKVETSKAKIVAKSKSASETPTTLSIDDIWHQGKSHPLTSKTSTLLKELTAMRVAFSHFVSLSYLPTIGQLFRLALRGDAVCFNRDAQGCDFIIPLLPANFDSICNEDDLRFILVRATLLHKKPSASARSRYHSSFSADTAMCLNSHRKVPFISLLILFSNAAQDDAEADYEIGIHESEKKAKKERNNAYDTNKEDTVDADVESEINVHSSRFVGVRNNLHFACEIDGISHLTLFNEEPKLKQALLRGLQSCNELLVGHERASKMIKNQFYQTSVAPNPERTVQLLYHTLPLAFGLFYPIFRRR